MLWTNYHSHTHYCDGSDKPELYIKNAIKNKMPAYGYSSHAPVNFPTDWCMPDSKFENYLTEVREIKRKYASEIQTYVGLEVDYIPDVAGRNRHIIANSELDYFIGSIHFVDRFADNTHWNIDYTKELFEKGLKEIYKNKFEKASERFYSITCQMIDNDKPDVIGHLDKIKMYNKNSIYFSESENWYKNQVESTLVKIKQAGTIVEINTRGFYRYGQKDLYPSAWIVKRMIDLDIPIMLNSDSHRPDEIIGGFEYAATELRKLGLKILWVLYDNIWQAKEFTEKGYIW